MEGGRHNVPAAEQFPNVLVPHPPTPTPQPQDMRFKEWVALEYYII